MYYSIDRPKKLNRTNTQKKNAVTAKSDSLRTSLIQILLQTIVGLGYIFIQSKILKVR